MPATAEAPLGMNAIESGPLDADTMRELNAAFPPEPTTPAPESTPVETPAAPPAPVEPPETETAPEPSETRSSATVQPVQANEPVRQPAAWQPGEDERQLANELGLPEAVVRGFSSATDFYRFAAWQSRQKTAAPSPTQQSAQAEAKLAKLNAVIDNPSMYEPEIVEAFKELRDEVTQVRQQSSQLAEVQKGQSEQARRDAYNAFWGQFASLAEEVDPDFLGKPTSSQPNPDQLQRLRAVHDEFLFQLGQGRVKGVNRREFERVYAFVHPEQTQQHQLRTLKEKAHLQAQSNLGPGAKGTAARPVKVDGVHEYPGLAEKAKELDIPLV